jgi:hypothetical protein
VAVAAAVKLVWAVRPPPPGRYLAVQPLLVAEIRVDQAHERGRWRNPPRDLYLRAELDASDVSLWTYGGPSA